MSFATSNEFIQLFLDKIKNKFILVVQSAPFFFIYLNTTQDLSTFGQLCKIECNEHDKSEALYVSESLLGLYKVEGQMSALLLKFNLNCCSRLIKKYCPFETAVVKNKMLLVIQAEYTLVFRTRISDNESSEVSVHYVQYN
jgi:hypothetical protein